MVARWTILSSRAATASGRWCPSGRQGPIHSSMEPWVQVRDVATKAGLVGSPPQPVYSWCGILLRGTRAHAPVRIAFHLRNSVGTREINLCGAQWLAYVFPCRRFAADLAGGSARLGSDVGRYSVIIDLHRPLVAGLPANYERFCTLSFSADDAKGYWGLRAHACQRYCGDFFRNADD